ncbi:Myb-like DNA-binding domain containing protein [Histomonas meleagridis]|uniref:Myb-like DNA-binding domain containing protein n=1 Tax=Histomonas meleagridis TaxID=135588 RepID=UPI00355949A8|nr:Myb-like DNA-binding domain containing protein [Histomonas meleagridis]KAH0799913.1 Myb-like DNA-binding domain containing protein [Histomonas meleagridis]
MSLYQSGNITKPENICMQEFIEKELNISAPELGDEVRKKLANIALGFFENKISMTAALTVFSECSCPATVITKLAHVKASGYKPLPVKKLTVDNLKTALMPTRKKSAVWKADEDMRLLTAISRYGTHDWVMISAFVGNGRTSSQCNQRWTRALNPAISREPWSAEEDQKLINIVNQLGEYGWRRIASQIPGRTDLQCRHRYLQLKRISNQNKISEPQTTTTTNKTHITLPSLAPTFDGSNPISMFPINFPLFNSTLDATAPPLIVKRGNLSLP